VNGILPTERQGKFIDAKRERERESGKKRKSKEFAISHIPYPISANSHMSYGCYLNLKQEMPLEVMRLLVWGLTLIYFY